MKKISIFLSLALTLISIKSFAAEVSITMDDFNVQEATLLTAQERNIRILETLGQHKLKAALFVVGKFVQDQAGKDLLSQWDHQKHLIGNHTYNHLYFGSKMTVDAYKDEIIRCETSLKNYSGFKKLLPDHLGRSGSCSVWVCNRFFRLIKEPIQTFKLKSIPNFISSFS